MWVLAAARSSSPTLFYAIRHTAALWELDPATNRIVGKPVRLNGPIALTADGTNVWVADGQGYKRPNDDATTTHARTQVAQLIADVSATTPSAAGSRVISPVEALLLVAPCSSAVAGSAV